MRTSKKLIRASFVVKHKQLLRLKYESDTHKKCDSINPSYFCFLLVRGVVGPAIAHGTETCLSCRNLNSIPVSILLNNPRVRSFSN